MIPNNDPQTRNGSTANRMLKNLGGQSTKNNVPSCDFDAAFISCLRDFARLGRAMREAALVKEAEELAELMKSTLELTDSPQDQGR